MTPLTLANAFTYQPPRHRTPSRSIHVCASASRRTGRRRRSASCRRRSDGDCRVPRRPGRPPDAGIAAEHVPGRGGQSLSELPRGICLSQRSSGTSLRHAVQFTLRRRLRNGLTASVQYTHRESTDDAATFSSTAVASSALAIAQDWRDLGAERGPSSFDQRHLTTAQVQYTTGVGVTGGTLVDGFWGSLYKDWTVTANLNAGSGLPASPGVLRRRSRHRRRRRAAPAHGRVD